jgi:phospholipase/carboxylesterase
MRTELKTLKRLPDGAWKPPTLVLLHGLGSNEQDLMSFGHAIDARWALITVRAPLQCEYGGFAWFDVAWEQSGLRANQDQALESLAALRSALDDPVGWLGFEPGAMVVGGFSQGAMMSLGLALIEPARFSGCLLMSGRTLPAFIPTSAPPGIEVLPFFIQHGELDPVIPVTEGRRTLEVIRSLGGDAEFIEYPMGHEVSMESLADAGAWLGARLANMA